MRPFCRPALDPVFLLSHNSTAGNSAQLWALALARRLRGTPAPGVWGCPRARAAHSSDARPLGLGDVPTDPPSPSHDSERRRPARALPASEPKAPSLLRGASWWSPRPGRSPPHSPGSDGLQARAVGRTGAPGSPRHGPLRPVFTHVSLPPRPHANGRQAPRGARHKGAPKAHTPSPPPWGETVRAGLLGWACEAPPARLLFLRAGGRPREVRVQPSGAGVGRAARPASCRATGWPGAAQSTGTRRQAPAVRG